MEFRKALCEEEEIYEIAQAVAKVLFKKIKFQFIEDLDDLTSEVAVILLEKRELFCSLKELRFSYVVAAVRNHLFDKYIRKNYLDEKNLDEIEEPVFANNYIEEIATKEAIEKLKRELTEKEMETFLYFLFSTFYKKEENPFLSNKSRDAKYKAWSRLKPKVAEILKEFDFTGEEMKKLGEALLSEYLPKSR